MRKAKWKQFFLSFYALNGKAPLVLQDVVATLFLL
jgi:hypothetical protein